MRIVELTEGTTEWRLWRHAGLGSSDAPAILGLSRYTDARALWQKKRASDSVAALPPPDDLRLARGRALEPEARRAVEARLNISLRPLCCEHSTHPELRASLDGWSQAQNLPVEIKCPSRALHAEALSARVPRRFVPQCLHILLVTGAARLLYASYQPLGTPRSQALAILEIQRDQTLCDQLQRIERDFWQSVKSGAPPPSTRLSLSELPAKLIHP